METESCSEGTVESRGNRDRGLVASTRLDSTDQIDHSNGIATAEVKMPWRGPVQRRATLCISSQVGCAMGCTFCSTGTMGLLGDLTAGEITEQLVHARSVMPIRNIVFMGMGEPLNNYEAVRLAVAMMTDPRWGPACWI